MDEKSTTIIKCHIHGIEYDYWDEHCPLCVEEYEAAKRILRRFTCGLCGELRASTTIMCGGAIGQLCQDCRDLIHKWEDAKKRQEERFQGSRGITR